MQLTVQVCNDHVNPKSVTGPEEGIKSPKENGNYFRMLGLYRDNGKKMKTTIICLKKV